MAAEGLGGLVGVVHVLLHDGGARQQDLALLAVGQLLVGVGLHDLDVGIREGDADAALLEHLGGRQAAGGDGLGGAVALPDLDDGLVVIEELVELLLELNGEAVAAGEDALQAAEVRAVHAGQAQQGLVEGGDAGDEVALVLGDELGVALGGEAGHQDAAPALGEHGVDAHAQAEAVEERHGGEHLVAGAEHGVGGDDLLAQGVEVAVGEDDALGGAGGAAGVEDDGGIVAGALDGIVPEAGAAHVHELPPADDGGVLGDLRDLAALGEHVAGLHRAAELILHAGDDDVHHLGVLADALKLVVELVQGDGGDALGLVEVELDLLLGGEGVDHVGDAAHEIHRVEEEDGLGAVGHGDGDPVAFPDADGPQGPGAVLDLVHQAGIGGGAAHEVKSDVAGILHGDPLHGLKHGAVKVIEVHGDAAHGAFPGRFGSDLSHIRPPYSGAAPAARDVPAGI